MCRKGACRWSASSSRRSIGPSPLSVKGACSSLKICTEENKQPVGTAAWQGLNLSLWHTCSEKKPVWECSAPSWASAVPCWVCWPWSPARPGRCWECPPRKTPDPLRALWRLWVTNTEMDKQGRKVQERDAQFGWWSSTLPYLLSFWVMVPFSSFPAMEARTLLASLAKSRSRTSAGETGTMAKASLSSFIEEVPILRCKKKRIARGCQQCRKTNSSHWRFLRTETHAQHDRLLLLLVNGLVGAVNPGVCAQMPEAHVRVPEKADFYDFFIFSKRKSNLRSLQKTFFLVSSAICPTQV